MTVPSTTPPRKVYTGSGTGPYPVTFQFDQKEEVIITHYDSDGVPTELTYTTHYSVSDPPSSEVTTVASYTASDQIVLTRRTDLTQKSNLKDNRTYSAEVLEGMVDRLTLMVQDQAEPISRALVANLTSSGSFDYELPSPVAGRAIGYNATADGLALVSDTTYPINSFWLSIFATDTEAAALTVFGWLGIVNAWTKQNYMSKTTLTITTGATTPDFDDNSECELTVDEDVTVNNFTNMVHGKSLSMKVIEDGGAHTISWGNLIDFAGQPSGHNSVDGAVTWYRFWTDGTKIYAVKEWEDD